MDKLKMPVFSSAPITQRFGENPLDYKAFGLAGHNGVDWGVPEGTPVRAAAGGEVARACMDSAGYGLHVRVQSAAQEVPGGCLTLYAHLSKLAVQQGQAVQAGELLGYSGNTGSSTGPHLHFEIRIAGGPAGYGGAVDPLPLLAPDLPPVEKVLFRARVVAALGVNVRSLPGMSGAVLGLKPSGTELDIYELRGDWARVAGGWACTRLGEDALIVRLDQQPDWYQAIDTWARGLGFTGPAAPKGK